MLGYNVFGDYSFLTVFIFGSIKLKHVTFEVSKMVVNYVLNSKHHICKVLNIVCKQKSTEQNIRK